jgi:hypothetical protein
MFVPEHSEHTDKQLPGLRKRLMSEEGSSWAVTAYVLKLKHYGLRLRQTHIWSLVVMIYHTTGHVTKKVPPISNQMGAMHSK